MNGVLIIDKPRGFTSFDVIAVVRRLTGERKTGHTGTLDPNATGVLPVLLGRATKAQDIIPDHDKEYRAEFRLGMTTDTLDIWGVVRERFDKTADRKALEAALGAFRGEISQIPPMYSAIKQNGKRLYDLARQGVEVARSPRTVTVCSLELLSFDEEAQEGELLVRCSKGTYVRTLIDDLGSALGTGAVMTALRRTCACGFTLGDCVSLDRLRALSESGQTETALRPVESLFAGYEAVTLSEAQAKRFRNGGALSLERTSLRGRSLSDGELFRVNERCGFIGLGMIRSDELRVYKLFCI